MDRDEILRRFEAMAGCAHWREEDPPRGIPAEILAGRCRGGESTVDWYTMWAAITALTQEVKLQGRGFKQLGETLAAR